MYYPGMANLWHAFQKNSAKFPCVFFNSEKVLHLPLSSEFNSSQYFHICILLNYKKITGLGIISFFLFISFLIVKISTIKNSLWIKVKVN